MKKLQVKKARFWLEVKKRQENMKVATKMSKMKRMCNTADQKWNHRIRTR